MSLDAAQSAQPRFASAADRLMQVAATALLLALLGCVFLGVVFRQFNRPLAWSDELAQYLLVWCGFTGWMIAARRRSHIRIEVFADRLPAGARRALEMAIQASLILFAALLLYHSAGLIRRNLDIEAISLPVSAALLYAPIPLAALATALQAGVEFLAAARGGSAAPQGDARL